MRFTVLRHLGRGATGEVSLVEDRVTGRRLALKRPLVDDEHARASLAREHRVSAALSHPNIVSVVEVGRDELGPFLALEFVDGVALSTLEDTSRLLGRPVPAEAICVLALALARALGAAHSTRTADGHGVVHRDVSAENVLVAKDGSIKLTDFGVAKMLGVTTGSSGGVLKGRLASFAPELLDGQAPSPASDVFGLGALLFRLLSGVDPFIGSTDAEVLRALRHGRAPSLHSFQTACPPEVVAWVDGALDRAPEARPPLSALVDALSVREGLGSVGRQQWQGLVELTLASERQPTGPWTASVGTTTRTARKWWPLVAIALAVVGLLALVQHLNPIGR